MKESKIDTWTTASGAKYKISEMDTSHIKNCLNYIKRTGIRGDYVEVFEEELKKRNLNITGNINKDEINEKEQLYFLEVSCGYVIITPKEINETLGEDLINWIKMNEKLFLFIINQKYLVCSEEKEKENLLKNLKNDILSIKQSKMKDVEFYDKWRKHLLVNVFSNEWSKFIDVMLGRY